LLVVLAVALLAGVPGLRAVLREIRHIGLGWIAVAVTLELASAISFVVVFRLFFDSLDAGDARALAWTAQGSGALLPGGGAGGLAIGGWLIALTGAPLRWIVRRSAGLFFLSAGVSGATLVGAGLALIAGAPGPHGPSVVVPTVLVALGLLLVAALPAILRARPHRPGWLAAIATGVREAEQTTFTRHPSWRLVGALGYLAFDIAVLWVTLRAIGHAPSVAVVTLAQNSFRRGLRSTCSYGCHRNRRVGLGRLKLSTMRWFRCAARWARPGISPRPGCSCTLTRLTTSRAWCYPWTAATCLAAGGRDTRSPGKRRISESAARGYGRRR
jgi:hypothetical protein